MRGSNPPREAPAEVRVAAAQLRAMFLALRQEGFTRGEALTIVCECISNASNNS